MKTLFKIFLLSISPIPICAQYGASAFGQNGIGGSEVHEWFLVDKTNQPIVRYEYRTDYFIDGEVFDFPIEKTWRLNRTARVWRKNVGIFTDQVLSVDARVIEPDTLIFERFASAQGRVIRFRLCRHFPRIYRAQYALPQRLPDGGYIWNDLKFFVGWPDDYMKTHEVRTDFREAEMQIHSKLAAGSRRAGFIR